MPVMAMTRLLDRDPLTSLDPAAVRTEWRSRGLDELSDGELIALCAAHIATPRRDPADSFVLHAPLELLARSALLRLVSPSERQRALQRIAWLAASYHAYDAADVAPPPARTSSVAPLDRLRLAIDEGDLDEVDRAGTELV